MAGMLLTGDAEFASFGVATMTVVAMAMLGSLTVLPALLSKLGDNVDRARVPFIHRLRRSDGEARIWGAIIDRVLRRPVLSIVLAGGFLVALAVPAYQLHTAQASVETFPQKFLTSYHHIKAAFPGTEIAASVVVKAPNVETQAVEDAIDQVKRRALATGVMNEPIYVDLNPAKTVANISIPVKGDGTDSTSNAALSALREEIIPVTLGTTARRRGRGHGHDRPVEGLQRPDEDRGSARLRLRVAVRLLAHGCHLPLDRDRSESDRAEPALDRSGVRSSRPRLPARLGEAVPRLRVRRAESIPSSRSCSS